MRPALLLQHPAVCKFVRQVQPDIKKNIYLFQRLQWIKGVHSVTFFHQAQVPGLFIPAFKFQLLKRVFLWSLLDLINEPAVWLVKKHKSGTTMTKTHHYLMGSKSCIHLTLVVWGLYLCTMGFIWLSASWVMCNIYSFFSICMGCALMCACG